MLSLRLVSYPLEKALQSYEKGLQQLSAARQQLDTYAQRVSELDALAWILPPRRMTKSVTTTFDLWGDADVLAPCERLRFLHLVQFPF